ncbi:MAG: hypothetical protein D6809_01885 [Gammaproteobacteria bacterium]|nr:MAG: hypothetical protein D6809_01885 [Gammaproteobacteria bacterium]
MGTGPRQGPGDEGRRGEGLLPAAPAGRALPPELRPRPAWWRSAWGWLAAGLPLAGAFLAGLAAFPPVERALPPGAGLAGSSPAGGAASLAAPWPGGGLVEVEVPTVAALERLFAELDYRWPPRGPVPAVAVRRLPRDLPAVQEVARRKALFLRIVLPLVLAEDRRVAEERRALRALLRDGLPPAGSPARRRLEALARRYGVRELGSAAARRRLLRRVDEVPPALALAQAAMESGWGTSRFALEGNNLFGQWTRSERQGLVPARRPEGHRYAVRAFPDLRASVRAYLHNLNTHRAYRELRAVRARLRAQGRPLDAEALAAGLWRYSQRGLAYVAELQAIIRANRLHLVLDGLRLRPAGARELVETPAGGLTGPRPLRGRGAAMGG